MAIQQQQIVFGAQTAQLTQAIQQVHNQLGELKEFAEGMTERLKELFTIHELVEFVRNMAELGEQTERFALQLGISTEQVGELAGVAALTGTSMESMALSMERMSLNVQRATRDGFTPGAQALKVIGLSAKDLVGLNADAYFAKLADAVSKFNPSLNLTNALMAIGGRSVAQMIPTLIEGKAAFEHFHEAIKNTGSVLSESTVKGMVGTQHEIVLLGKSFQGLGATVFGVFKPAIDGVVLSLTDLAQWSRKSIEEGGALGEALKFVGEIANLLARDLNTVVAMFKALAAVLSFKIGLGADFKTETDKLLASLAEINKQWIATYDAITAHPLAAEHGEGHKQDAAAMQEGLRQQLRMQMEALQMRIKLADMAYASESERLDTAVKTYMMTEEQKTVALRAALGQRDTMEQFYLAKELALWPKGTPEYQKVLDEMTLMHAKFINEVQKLNDKLMIDQVRDWTTDIGMIQHAWDAQLQGLLAHTTSWATAMKKIAADLVLEIIKKFETIVIAQPLATAAAKAFGAIDLTAIFKTIAALLAQTFTGITAFFAPTIGPAAPAAAAGVTAGVEAAAMSLASKIPGAEIGAWNVPATSPWLLHRGETVLPSKAADAFRSLAAGSGLGQSGATFNITAFDGTDVLRVLNRHAGTFARVLRGHMAANPTSHG